MPKLATVTNAQRNTATKTRRVKQPKRPVGLSGPSGDGYTIGENGLITPSRDDMRAFGNVIFAPTAAEIAQFGDAEHTAYVATHAPDGWESADTISDADIYESDAYRYESEIYQRDPAAFGLLRPDTPSLDTTVHDIERSTGEPITPQHPPAANTAAATPAVKLDTDRMLARRAAAKAVSEFYAGASLPFKAAVDLQYRAAINFGRFVPGTITGTERTAAAIAAVLAYCNVNSDGTFIRGSGSVPRRLLGLTERPDEMLRAGLESGVLSRLIGTGAVSYISGATHGKQCDEAIFRVNYSVARTNMLAHNDTTPNGGERKFSRPLALLETTVANPATPA